MTKNVKFGDVDVETKKIGLMVSSLLLREFFQAKIAVCYSSAFPRKRNCKLPLAQVSKFEPLASPATFLAGKTVFIV